MSPAMTPKRGGRSREERIAATRWDVGTLTSGWGVARDLCPNVETDEALREVVRAREDAVEVPTRGKPVMVEGVCVAPRAALSRASRVGMILYRRWLAGLTMSEPGRHRLRCRSISPRSTRLSSESTRLTDQLRLLGSASRWAPVVAALQALRGVSFITATVLGGRDR